MNNFENRLSSRINERIQSRGFCILYDHELGRICPPETGFREKQIREIRKFAARHALAVCIRDPGINATFKRPAASKSQSPSAPINGSGVDSTVVLQNGAHL
jgi:hypothetical protein